jgi:hypothetical protein
MEVCTALATLNRASDAALIMENAVVLSLVSVDRGHVDARATSFFLKACDLKSIVQGTLPERLLIGKVEILGSHLGARGSNYLLRVESGTETAHALSFAYHEV